MGEPGGRNLIEIVDLHKALAGKPVLKGVSLQVPEGKTTCVVGVSGCGKSTLLRHVCGLLKPDRGQVLVDGQDVGKAQGAELDAIRRNIGVLFQSGGLLGGMNVMDNVCLPLIEHGVKPNSKAQEIARKRIEMVRMTGFDSYMPAELSGGMRKRVGIARAVVEDPKIVLYDEPTTGLDPVNRAAIHDLICNLRESLNITSLVITHDIEGAYEIGDYIAMLHDGRIIEAAPAEAFRDSKDPVVRQFVEGRSEGPLSAISAAGAM